MNIRIARIWTCLDCGIPVGRKVKRCPEHHRASMKQRPGYLRTPEHRELMSARLRGKPKNYVTGGSLPGVSEKIAAAWTPEMKAAAKQRGLAMGADRAWRDLIARSVCGTLNPNYQGKDHESPYAPGWGRRHKELIRERAGYRCELCGKPPVSSAMKLDIHHKDKTKSNHHPDNLQALCRKCHKRVHH